MGSQRESRGENVVKTNLKSLGNEGESGRTGHFEGINSNPFPTKKQLKHNPRLPPPAAAARTSSKAKNGNLSRLRERRKPPRSMEKGVMVRVDEGDMNELNGGSEMGDSREDDASLSLQLRQASDEVESLRRDMATAARERLTWQQRDDELRLMLAKLGSRCEDLEGSLREESHAAYIESTRAKSAEDRFQKLLGWARKEEERRRRAEEGLVRASEEGRALEARVTVADQELIEIKRQLDTRRFQLERALEDLRRRTAENERLEEQAKLMQGELLTLREVRDERGSEVKELREKMTSLMKEAKSVSSENVKVRKQLCGERERWRATERSRARQDKRRQIEIERKAEDMLALRYRIQELEARLSSEIRRRRGAEEDARRSQQMERRSMEELMETRDTGHSHQPGRSSRFYTADQSTHQDYGGALSANSIWHSWEDGMDTAPAAPPPSAGPSWITAETVGVMGSTPYPLLLEEQSRKRWDSIGSSKPSPHSFGPSPSHVPHRAAWTPSASMSRQWDTPPVAGAAEHTVASREPSSCSRQLSHSPEVLLYEFPRQGRPRPRQPPTDDCGDVDGVNKGSSGFEGEQKLGRGRGSEGRDGGRV